MELDRILEDEATQTESYFRAALAREDIARIEKLRDLVRAASDCEEFCQKAQFVGWTAGDLRSAELRPALEPFLRAFWATERESVKSGVVAEWSRFNAERMRILIHCL